MSPPRDAAAACPLNSIDRQQVETQRKSVRQSSDRPAGWGTTSPLWSCQRKGSTDKLLSVEDSKTQISLKWTKTRSFFCISTTFFLYSISHWISRQTTNDICDFFFIPSFSIAIQAETLIPKPCTSNLPNRPYPCIGVETHRAHPLAPIRSLGLLPAQLAQLLAHISDVCRICIWQTEALSNSNL